MPIEIQKSPNTLNPFSISDLVSSLITIKKDEGKKAKLEEQVVSLTKSLLRARQFPQFSGTITSYQFQLEKVQEELSNHTKSIHYQRQLSAQAEINFDAVLSKPKSNSETDAISEKVEKLQSRIDELQKPRESCGPNGPHEQLQNAQDDVHNFRETLNSSSQSLAEFKTKMTRVEDTLHYLHKDPEFTVHAMRQMTRIANSVEYVAKQDGKMKSHISKLQTEMSAANRNNEEKFHLFEEMAQSLEDALKVLSESTESEVTTVKKATEAFIEQGNGRISGIETNLGKLTSDRENIAAKTSKDVVQLGSYMEAQKQQLEGRIAAEEEHLNGLMRAQESNILNGPGAPRGAMRLEDTVKRHDSLLGKIQHIHSNAQDAYFNQMEEIRNAQRLVELAWRNQHEEISKKLDNLTATVNDKAFATENSVISDQLKTQLQDHKEEVKKGLDGLVQIPNAVKKCEARIETQHTALRSLETRYTNLTTGDLVTQMAREMQTMYPSVGQLSQQLTDTRADIDLKLSAHDSEIQNLTTEVLHLKPEFEFAKEEIAKVGAAIHRANAERELNKSQADMNDLNKPELSPEELDALKKYPDCLLKISQIEEQIEAMRSIIGEHGGDLKNRLQEFSNLNHKYEIQQDSVVELSESLDQLSDTFNQRQQEHQDVIKSVGKIDVMRENVHNNTLQLEKVVADFESLARDLSSKNETENFEGLQLRLIRLEDSLSVDPWGSKHTKDLQDIQSRLKELEDLKQDAPEEPKDTKDLEDIQSRLKKLEDLKQDAPEKPHPDILEEHINYLNEQGDKMKGYLKRMRLVEDWAKAMGYDPKKSVVPDKPIEQRVEARETPRSWSSGRSLTPSNPAGNTISSTFPKGPSLGIHTPTPRKPEAWQANNASSPPNVLDLTVKGQASHSSVVLTSRQQSPTGNLAQPRQVQALKGKRRRDSVGFDSERSTPEPTSVSGSSPASSFSSLSKREIKEKKDKERERMEKRARRQERKAEEAREEARKAKKRKV